MWLAWAAFWFVWLSIYGGVVTYDLLLWDDDVWWSDPLLELPLGEAVSTAVTTTWDGVAYPGLRLSWWAEHQVTGGHVGSAHLAELGLFASLVFVVWRLARLYGVAELPAFMCVTAWALHPRHVESIAWLTGRKDLLSVCVLCLGLWVSRYPRLAWLTPWLFAIGVSVKAPAVSLVAVFAVLWWARPELAPSMRIRVASWCVSVAVALVCLVPTVGAGQHVPTETMSWAARAMALQTHWHLGGLGLIAPAAVYDVRVDAGMILTGVVLTALWIVWCVRGGAQRRMRWAVAALWWLPLLPYSGVLDMAIWGADRHLLVPSLGLWAALGWATHGWWEKAPRRLMALWLVLATWWGMQSAARVGAWSSDLSLWTAEEQKPGEHWIRTFKLGMALARGGQFEEASARFSKTYAVHPTDEVAARWLVARLAAGGWDASIHRVASELVPAPTDPGEWMQVSEAMFRVGRRDEARFAFDHCVSRWGDACVPGDEPSD